MRIAENRQRTSANTPSLHPFSPATWLARYVELGGGYSLVGDAIWLHWLLSRDVDETAIVDHERILRGRPDRREAVKALILENVSQEAAE